MENFDFDVLMEEEQSPPPSPPMIFDERSSSSSGYSGSSGCTGSSGFSESSGYYLSSSSSSSGLSDASESPSMPEESGSSMDQMEQRCLPLKKRTFLHMDRESLPERFEEVIETDDELLDEEIVPLGDFYDSETETASESESSEDSLDFWQDGLSVRPVPNFRPRFCLLNRQNSEASINSFGDMITEKILILPPETQRDVQNKIARIVLNAEIAEERRVLSEFAANNNYFY